MEVLRQDDWTTEVTTRLRTFEKSLIVALKEKGWDGKESEETVTWTFAGGLFYSITVITTIGKLAKNCQSIVMPVKRPNAGQANVKSLKTQ